MGSYAPENLALDQRLADRAAALARRLSLGTIVRGLPRRIVYLWGVADHTPSNHRFTSAAYTFGYVNCIALTLLMLIGLLIRRARLVSDWPLWIIAVYVTMVHLLYQVEARYTLPARPTLMIYAAVTLGAFADAVRGPRAALEVVKCSHPKHEDVAQAES